MGSELYDVTYWDGSRLIASAKDIIARDERQAVRRGLRAIHHRSRVPYHDQQLAALAQHMDLPSIHPVPDGIRAFAAKKQRGVKVVG